ncbi:MAG: proton-conducting transporter membrane subunit [Clostridia bacterium]
MSFTDGLMFSLGFDSVGVFFATLTATLFLLTALYTLSYAEHDEHRGRLYLFLLLTLLALVGLSAAKNLLTFYLFFEVLSMVSFPLVLHTGTEEARRASVKYLGFSVFGATMALFGMLLLGRDCMQPFSAGGMQLPVSTQSIWALLLMTAGFCCKAGLIPLSNWLPTAHPEAPAPASALLSGVITKAGMLGLIRVCYFVFGVDAVRGSFAQTVLLILALATIFVGSMLAYREQMLKKRLAYSSISQLSYVVLGIMTLNATGLVGALMQIAFHSAAKVGLFLCAGAIMHQTGYTRVSQLTGIGKRMPGVMLCFTAFSLSLVGIPPFGGFVAKWGLGMGVLQENNSFSIAAVVMLLVSALLTAGYLFPIIGNAFFAGDRATIVSNKTDWRMLLPLAVLALFVLLAGAFPMGLTGLFHKISTCLIGGAA